MIIAVDVDNVLNNLQESVTNIFNKRYGTKYTMDDFENYNVSECLNKEDAMNFIAIYSEPGVYDSVSPLSDAQRALTKLKNIGHEIYLVTHSDPQIFKEKCDWIKYHFAIDDAHIISMQHKWLFKCDLLIEDNMDNLLGGHHYDRICFDYPWNRGVRDEVYGIHRVSNWRDAINIINKMN